MLKNCQKSHFTSKSIEAILKQDRLLVRKSTLNVVYISKIYVLKLCMHTYILIITAMQRKSHIPGKSKNRIFIYKCI